MKRNPSNVLYSIALLLFITLPAQAQEEHKVAVFDPAGTVEKSLLEIVREEISSVVVNITGYTVLERQLINKVLEENRFQESGLVNDEQVSDIGKRMGADYVFVTSISLLGRNYYISCKMIEVATARIERQSTGTTTDGINDIPQTTQYIVRRLFGENVQQPVTNRQPQQTDRPIQTAATPTRQTEDNYRIQGNTYDGRLVAKKANVYSSGKALQYDEIREIMAITDALKYYDKGIRQNQPGNALKTIGLIGVGIGAFIELSNLIDGYDEMNPGIGGVVSFGSFFVFAIPGFVLKDSAKKNVRKAVDVYNNSMYGYSEYTSSFEIDFGITSNGGIGFVLRF